MFAVGNSAKLTPQFTPEVASMFHTRSKGRSFTTNDLPRSMKPREFCRAWFHATPTAEETRGYRRQCVKLLAEVIGLEEDTVDRWGSGLDFPGMPSQYENTLGYALTIKQMLEAAGSQRSIFEAVLEQRKKL